MPSFVLLKQNTTITQDMMCKSIATDYKTDSKKCMKYYKCLNIQFIATKITKKK